MDITRHQSIFNPADHERPALVVGAGAIGSHVVMQLVSLGCEDITVIDFDCVEEHNLANQVFLPGDVGAKKIVALNEHVRIKMGAPTGRPYICHYDKKVPDELDLSKDLSIFRREPAPALFLCVDSMRARGEIMRAMLENAADINCHVIDTRMAASHGNVYSFDFRSKVARWLMTLSDDSLASVSPCGTPLSVIPTVQLISSLAVWEYIKYCTGDEISIAEATNVFLNPTCMHVGKLPSLDLQETDDGQDEVEAQDALEDADTI